MEKGNNTVGIIIAVIVALGIGGLVVFALANKQPAAPATEQQPTTEIEETTKREETTNAADVTIVYTDSGFEQSSYTVKSGGTVKVTNNSSQPLQFSSDNHPTHTKDSELNLETIDPGKSTTLTPTRTGTWGFHNTKCDQTKDRKDCIGIEGDSCWVSYRDPSTECQTDHYPT